MNRVEGTMPSARFYFVCAGAKIGGWPCPGVQNRCFLGCGVKAAVMQKHNHSQRVLQTNAPLRPRGQECRNQPTITNKTRACRMGKFALCKPLFYCAGEREQPHPVRPIRGRFQAFAGVFCAAWGLLPRFCPLANIPPCKKLLGGFPSSGAARFPLVLPCKAQGPVTGWHPAAVRAGQRLSGTKAAAAPNCVPA